MEAEESDDEGDSEESGKKSDNKLPVVVGLGVKGVFSIIRDIWHKQPDLCLRALMEFVNILQGQSPDGLKNEPKKTTGLQCNKYVCMLYGFHGRKFELCKLIIPFLSVGV